MRPVYIVTCETIDEDGDVKDWFECFNSDDPGIAIRWAEGHVLDYVGSECEQLTVLKVDDERQFYARYDEWDIIWCSQ